jgi:16S rRNA A1518/A1519 N6-dimethyltransferase RsmA/KsgA/DIM1 with predicted DNA glycosylase/AP lyase activity
MFYPQPDVDSVILSIKPLGTKPFEIKDAEFFLRLVKWLFTQRNKKLAKAISPFIRSNFKLTKQEAEKIALSIPHNSRRVRELHPKDFGDIVNALLN